MKKLLIALSIIASGCVESELIVADFTVPNQDALYVMHDALSGEYAGELEVVEHFDGSLDLTQRTGFIIKNEVNGTHGIMPTFRVSSLESVNGVVLSRNVNFTNTQDVESDLNGSDISGSHFTTHVVSIDKGVMSVTVTVYSGASNSNGGINDIIFERHFESVK